MNAIELIKSDLYRYSGNINVSGFFRHYFLSEGFNYLFWHRIGSSIKLRPIRMFFSLILKFKQRRFGIIIPLSVKIGPGFYIGHFGGIVVNSTAVIGENCNISQGVTIGANLGTAARIGNFVYIGPNSCLIEAIEVGDYATIGAGSVVTKSVGRGVTVAGVPAKVIRSGDGDGSSSGRFILNRWGESELYRLP